MKIFKYELKIATTQCIYIPKESKILSVGVQKANIVLWVLVTEAIENVPRIIEVCGTGRTIPESNKLNFIGTVIINPFVWHIFERIT